jgi:hypothetical protein
MKTVFAPPFLSLFLLVLVAGCKHTNTPERADELMVSGWVGPAPAPSTAQATYCYETLGQVDCYNKPQPGWEHRLVGFYEPPKVEKKPKATAATCNSKPPKAIPYVKPKQCPQKKKVQKCQKKPNPCPKGCVPAPQKKASPCK